MTPEIAIVVSPRGWAESLHRFVADHGGARVVARVLDAREALDERYQVLVAEDLTSFLTPRLVSRLHATGRRVLGVFDPVEPWGRERLRELGVDDVAASNTPPEEILQAIAALTLTGGLDLDAELAALESSPAGSIPTDQATPGGAPPGTLIAVGGPAGGPGATEIALALARGLHQATTGGVALVDADDAAPALAQRLNLPLHPNLRTAIDVVQHGSGDLDDVLATVDGVRLLAGLPSPADALEVRAGEVVDVLADLRDRFAHVVADVGHRLEDVAGRYEVTRQVIGAADLVVAVGAPSPVGVSRLLGWLADVRALSPARVHLVIDKAPAAPFARGEIADEIGRSFTGASTTFVPFDRRVRDAAWAGTPVAGGPFVKAVAPLAAAVRDTVVTGPAPTRDR